MLNTSPLCVLGATDPSKGIGWPYFNDLPCADFDLQMCTGFDEFNMIVQSPRAEDIAIVIIDSNLAFDAIQKVQNTIEKELGSWSSDVPLFLMADTERHDPDALAKMTGVRRILDLSVNISSLRTQIGIAMDEFRNLVQLRRELENRTSAIGQIVSGEFHFRTREEAQNLATMLSIACPRSVEVVIGLTELMVNAVEHGNLEIGHAEKGHLIEIGMMETEVCKRLSKKPYSERHVTVCFERKDNCYEFRIHDEGPGFDFIPYLTQALSASDKKHGRGIQMARSCFDTIRYEDKGNIVCVGGCYI